MEPPSPHTFIFLNETESPIQVEVLERAGTATASQFQLRSGEIHVCLCSNENIQFLNREFRGIDEATDVLTFPARDLQFPDQEQPALVGDLAISIEYAQKQADLRGAPLLDEVAYLVIHGVLHLCGFEDETKPEQKKMQAAMCLMGKRLGLIPVAEWTSLLHTEVGAKSR